jgi:hypothetical protein
MRTNYTIKDVELIEQEAYKTGLEFGELQARDRIIELLRSEEELLQGFLNETPSFTTSLN